MAKRVKTGKSLKPKRITAKQRTARQRNIKIAQRMRKSGARDSFDALARSKSRVGSVKKKPMSEKAAKQFKSSAGQRIKLGLFPKF